MSLGAALLLCVSYHHVFFSQNARGYSPYILFALLSILFFSRALRHDRLSDWTAGHCEDIQAEIRAAIKRVLRKKGIKAESFAFIIPKVMEQAKAMYRDWPVAV